jgi:hypothetical protein
MTTATTVRPGRLPNASLPGRRVRTDRPASLLARLEAWLWRTRQGELERRLASCASTDEVEATLREQVLTPAHRRYE